MQRNDQGWDLFWRDVGIAPPEGCPPPCPPFSVSEIQNFYNFSENDEGMSGEERIKDMISSAKALQKMVPFGNKGTGLSQTEMEAAGKRDKSDVKYNKKRQEILGNMLHEMYIKKKFNVRVPIQVPKSEIGQELDYPGKQGIHGPFTIKVDSDTLARGGIFEVWVPRLQSPEPEPAPAPAREEGEEGDTEGTTQEVDVSVDAGLGTSVEVPSTGGGTSQRKTKRRKSKRRKTKRRKSKRRRSNKRRSR